MVWQQSAILLAVVFGSSIAFVTSGMLAAGHVQIKGTSSHLL